MSVQLEKYSSVWFLSEPLMYISQKQKQEN